MLHTVLLQDLAIVGYALAKLGLRPPSTWLRRYCALLLKYKSGLYRNKTLLTQVSNAQLSAIDKLLYCISSCIGVTCCVRGSFCAPRP